jgi:hypothetical protein
MPRARHALVATLAAASLALGAGPALARGGSGSGGGDGSGGGTTTPTTPTTPTAEPWALCPEYAQGGIVLADGSTTFANQVTGVGCFIVRSSGGTLSIYKVTVADGWTYTTNVSAGNKLSVEYANTKTGERHRITVEPGKTVIR